MLRLILYSIWCEGNKCHCSCNDLRSKIYTQIIIFTELREPNQNLSPEVGRPKEENSQLKKEFTQRYDQLTQGKRNATLAC